MFFASVSYESNLAPLQRVAECGRFPGVETLSLEQTLIDLVGTLKGVLASRAQ